MNNDSTRNGGRLSLQERAARGLLSLQENSELLSLQERVARGLLPSEPELLLSELMKLEFPSHTSYEERQQPEYKGWHKAIEAAIGFKLLKARDEELTEQLRVITGLGRHGEETRHFGTITRYWITRENYRAWRLTQNNPPAGSFIHLWLGATPATESIPPVETSLPEPARPASVAKPKKRRRDDALTHAIRAALAVLSPNGGPLPSPRKLFDYLKESDSTRTITGLSNDGKALMWAGKVNDSPQKADIRVLAARLRRWQS